MTSINNFSGSDTSQASERQLVIRPRRQQRIEGDLSSADEARNKDEYESKGKKKQRRPYSTYDLTASSSDFGTLRQEQQEALNIPSTSNSKRPRQARLKNNHVELGGKCNNTSTHGQALDNVAEDLNASVETLKGHEARFVPSPLNLVTGHWKHLTKKPGLNVVFEAKEQRSFSSASTHYLGSHHYLLPTEQALLMMSGAHDKAQLFAQVLFEVSENDEMVKELCDHLQRGAFISPACLNEAVHVAATRGLSAQNPTSRPPGPDANHHIYRAHRVIAAYLVGLKTKSLEGAALPVFEAVMRALTPPVSSEDGRDKSAYAGVVTGIVLGGMMRFFKDELNRGTENRERLETGLAILAGALAFIPVAGPFLPGFIAPLAKPLVKRAIKTRDMSEHVVCLGAGLEDAALRVKSSRFDAQQFNIQLEKTMRHCGFSY